MASVLIVDDHLGTLDMLSTLLRTAGFETARARTGQEAIDLAIPSRFDVILVDLHLPDIPGVDVVRAVKLSGVASRMIVMTVFPEPGTPFDVDAAGADGYVDGLLWDTEVVDVVSQAMTGPFPVRYPPTSLLKPTESKEPRSIPMRDHRAWEVKRRLDANLGKDLSVAQLAVGVGLSESRLEHVFVRCFGIPLIAYRLERRLKAAALGLTTTYERIRQIAYGVGFRSQSLRDFRRVFRQRFGVSPQAYRTRFWRGTSDADR
jgi:AraC-like DNA-binding protein/CheY-like chemotaxis protein